MSAWPLPAGDVYTSCLCGVGFPASDRMDIASVVVKCVKVCHSLGLTHAPSNVEVLGMSSFWWVMKGNIWSTYVLIGIDALHVPFLPILPVVKYLGPLG